MIRYIILFSTGVGMCVYRGDALTKVIPPPPSPSSRKGRLVGSEPAAGPGYNEGRLRLECPDAPDGSPRMALLMYVCMYVCMY